jgi:hypothetical protein
MTYERHLEVIAHLLTRIERLERCIVTPDIWDKKEIEQELNQKFCTTFPRTPTDYINEAASLLR